MIDYRRAVTSDGMVIDIWMIDIVSIIFDDKYWRMIWLNDGFHVEIKVVV